MSRDVALAELLPLVQVAEALAQKYDVVVTNPPYMGMPGMSADLANYVKNYYPDSKTDLFAVFIEKCKALLKVNGYQAMITQHAWMFLSSYEKLRQKLFASDIVNMAHLGARAFEEIGGEVVQTTSFVIANRSIKKYEGIYCRLAQPTTQQGKEDMFLAKENVYCAKQSSFSAIPGNPIAYWLNESFVKNYEKYPLVGNVSNVKKGMFTGANDLFFRLWHEPLFSSIDFGVTTKEEVSNAHYVPMNSGGSFRRWYGNRWNIIKFDKKHYDMITANKGHRNPQFYFQKSAVWTKITTGNFSLRISEAGFINNDASMAIYKGSVSLELIAGLLNSKVAQYYLNLVNESLNYTTGNVSSIPYISNNDAEIEKKVNSCIDISRTDWDSFETSWDFQHHPLLRKVSNVSEAFDQWQNECDNRFNQLKANEEELNRIFINIYGLQDELTPEVEDKDVTVRKADLGRDIRSFISYAVGCMFGRYSIYRPGLIYAGGDWKSVYGDFPVSKIELNENIIHGSGFHTYGTPITNRAVVYLKEPNEMKDAEEFWGVDADNIIPICDDEYFEDDIVGLFVEFVKMVYGAETLDENLKFIADALGGKGQPKDVIRNYFLNDFYTDHCKIYQKRPIYWLFDSGKKNGFKALIYMHRYQPDTIARIRTDYVHEQQARYRTAIVDLEQRIANASTGERVKLNKKLTALQGQDAEIRTYEEKIHHLADQMISIDLDDGVKKNYAIFQDVLAKIK